MSREWGRPRWEGALVSDKGTHQLARHIGVTDQQMRSYTSGQRRPAEWIVAEIQRVATEEAERREQRKAVPGGRSDIEATSPPHQHGEVFSPTNLRAEDGPDGAHRSDLNPTWGGIVTWARRGDDRQVGDVPPEGVR